VTGKWAEDLVVMGHSKQQSNKALNAGIMMPQAVTISPGSDGRSWEKES
jgi:hypothetical protein